MNQKSQSGRFNMRGYSKMKLPVANTSSLTSMDMIMPPNLDPAAIIFTTDSGGGRRSLRLISSNQLEEPDEVKGEVFGVILSRKSPSGHSDSRRLGRPRPDHDQRSSSSSLHSAVRRVFSMKRSCSVSERYCRIHDNFFPLSSHHDHHAGDGDGEAPPVWMGSSSKKKKVQLTNSKLLKACKRIFGL